MGWRDSSVDKVLALQHRGAPEFGPQGPQRSLASMGAEPRTQVAGTEIPGVSWLARQARITMLWLQHQALPQQAKWRVMRGTPHVNFRPYHAPTRMCTHKANQATLEQSGLRGAFCVSEPFDALCSLSSPA